MSLDGVVVHAVVHELQTLRDGRISKIHQPSEHDIVMQVRAAGHNHKLLLSANPSIPRAHLTSETFVNPAEAPMFCMLLRKHCENGIIERIEQVGMERVIHMYIRQRDEIGDLSVKLLIIELMGRHSNIILADPASQTILDGIHHVTPALSSYRIVMPGVTYTPPPAQDKHNLLDIPAEQLRASLPELFEYDAISVLDSSEVIERKLMDTFSGIGPLTARELVHRAASGGSLHQELENLHHMLRTGAWEPCILEKEDGKTLFSALRLTHTSGELTTFGQMSECLTAYFSEKAQRDLVKQRTADLMRFLTNELSKNEKKLEKLYESLKEAQEADRYRKLGELLTASLHLITRGQTSVDLIDYYDEAQPTITVTLDPQLTPSENAQRLFKRYNKLKNSLIAVQEQIESTKQEIEYFKTLIHQLNDASLADVDEIREELAAQGYVRNRNSQAGKKKKAATPAPLMFRSSEGIAIYVGKNNTQNDYLTNRLAHPNDTWLHTKDIPGSHVVIRSSSYGDETLLAAAQLAAYYSQARTSSQVPVDYTLIKHVRKPNGAKPGFVIYDHQKTLYITPDESYINRLERG